MKTKELKLEKMADAAEMLWVVLANVNGGDWSKQSKEWQKVAARWRDNYFEAMDEAGLMPTSEVIDEVIENEENNCKCGGIKLPESDFCKDCI